MYSKHRALVQAILSQLDVDVLRHRHLFGAYWGRMSVGRRTSTRSGRNNTQIAKFEIVKAGLKTPELVFF